MINIRTVSVAATMFALVIAVLSIPSFILMGGKWFTIEGLQLAYIGIVPTYGMVVIWRKFQSQYAYVFVLTVGIILILLTRVNFS